MITRRKLPLATCEEAPNDSYVPLNDNDTRWMAIPTFTYTTGHGTHNNNVGDLMLLESSVSL